MVSASSMTVAVLRKELEKRSLDVKGLKPALVARLQPLLDAEGADAAAPAREPEVSEGPKCTLRSLVTTRRRFRGSSPSRASRTARLSAPSPPLPRVRASPSEVNSFRLASPD